MAEDRLSTTDIKGLISFGILLAAFIYLAIRFIDAIAGVLIVFGIVLLAALVLNPIVSWAEQHKVPRVLSTIILALLLIGFLVLLGFLIIPPAVSQFTQLITEIPVYLDNMRSWANDRFPNIASRIPASGETLVQETIQRIVPLLGGILGYAASFANLIVTAFLIFLATIYVLTNPLPLLQGFIALFPQKRREKVINATQRLSRQMLSWAYGTLISMFLVFGMTWLALSIIGVEAAFLFALIAGVFEAVPTVGPIIAAIPPTLIALGEDPILALWVVIAYVVIQQVESQLIFPLVMSGQVELHPVSIIFAVLVMGGLFGIIGIFLAVPAAMLVKVLVYVFYIEPRNQGEEKSIEHGAEEMVIWQNGADSKEDQH
ncbi:MAG TPA: AI-2E family transporter [Armatimonadota bacterium]|nr:AI-2E family transporter [Armatimonadota bacterium]HOM72215.1 AI-2E family transporter [Armatimonadota bacterium]HPP75015.1 AI-2E family transporter [Armatimonadota bacterium]